MKGGRGGGRGGGVVTFFNLTQKKKKKKKIPCLRVSSYTVPRQKPSLLPLIQFILHAFASPRTALYCSFKYETAVAHAVLAALHAETTWREEDEAEEED